MTKTVTVTWDLPTTTKNGNPLDLAQVAGVEVALDAGAGPAVATTVPTGDAQSWVFPDLVDGNYVIILTVLGVGVPDSAPIATPVAIDDSGPSEVVNVNITLT